MEASRTWTFRVNARTRPHEVVCVVGSCPSLGAWQPRSLVPLTLLGRAEVVPPEDEEESSDKWKQRGQLEGVWTGAVDIPYSKVSYRYCVALRPTDDTFAILRWETHFSPRPLPADRVAAFDDVEDFGVRNGVEKVEDGWLVDDVAVQITLSRTRNHPEPVVLWKKKHLGKRVRIKVTPVSLAAGAPCVVEDSCDQGGRPPLGAGGWPCTQAAVLTKEDCKFEPLHQFGVPYDSNHFTVFQCRLLNVEKTAYMLDIYVEGPSSHDVPEYIGCGYLLPSNLNDNFGSSTLPITSPKHLPIGQITVHYMVVKPVPTSKCDLSVSYARYWKKSWTGMEVGHRGAGNSYHNQPRSCANIRENTIASFKYAAEIGADMVEIDVQLSKDLVPVIYHDFHAFIALKHKREPLEGAVVKEPTTEPPKVFTAPVPEDDLLEVAIKDLKLSQLKALKLYHRKENGTSKFSDENFEDHQPFPTLEQALRSVPDSCGFNVEVKWTMRLHDGQYELLHPFELNTFLDLIIKVVLEHGGNRKIIFSGFHPDICTMLRLKQNRYPVLFLTQGTSEFWPAYDDSRCETIEQAVCYASSADILGINLHTEDLMKDSTQINLAKEHNLVVFCWGEHNNDKQTIAFLKDLGMDAIIYDKIDVYNCKTSKKSVFLQDSEEEEEDATEDLGSGVSVGSSDGPSPNPPSPLAATPSPNPCSEREERNFHLMVTEQQVQ